MSQSDIVVFGSINLDMVFVMEELPAPGQTRLASGFSMQPGGKGANQAVAARRAGAAVHMVGAVGEDGLAPLALAIMAEAGVDLTFVRRIADASTGCAGIATDSHGRNQIAVALGANALLSVEDLPDALLDPARILLVQMEAEPNVVAVVMQRAHTAGMPVILNLAPAGLLPKAVLQTASLIVVNEDEAEVLGTQLACEATAEALYAALGVTVILTLGGEGAEAASPDGLVRVAAPHIRVVDTTAAGDCFVGNLAVFLGKRLPLVHAVGRACNAAALACMVAGSQRSLPTAVDVDAFAGAPPERPYVPSTPPVAHPDAGPITSS